MPFISMNFEAGPAYLAFMVSTGMSGWYKTTRAIASITTRMPIPHPTTFNIRFINQHLLPNSAYFILFCNIKLTRKNQPNKNLNGMACFCCSQRKGITCKNAFAGFYVLKE
jgi:hypothetical protein